VETQPKTMPIILFLGRNINEYEDNRENIIQELMISGTILCELCLQPMKKHSVYKRKIKETGQKITINVVWCSACRKWHALLPDFLLPRKHYSGNEIESVIIDSASDPVSQIETDASEATVRRWIKEIGERVKRACGKLKYLFKRAGKSISEVAIIAGSAYNELEQILDMAPSVKKCSGNKLGLANLWLGTDDIKTYI
jgi:hypothetical protein